MWEDAAANSVGAGGVDMPADVQQDKKKKNKSPQYDGRTKEGRKFVEKMLARRKARVETQQVNAAKQNLASVAMKEESVDEELVGEAMTDKEKKKRLAMIKKSVERINSKNADKAKKDALKMMKDSGMFDETVEEAKARPPKIKGLSLYGSEISGLKQGMKTFSAKPVVSKGKLGYRVMDEFGGFETLDLKAFAKKFG